MMDLGVRAKIIIRMLEGVEILGGGGWCRKDGGAAGLVIRNR